MRCPCCGADLKVADKIKYCEFCGFEERETRVINKYNLVIAYSRGVSPDLKIKIRSTNIDFDLKVGTMVNFKLAPGPHEIVFQEGGRKESRFIIVPDKEDQIVQIDYSYDQNREVPVLIKIIQPEALGSIELKDGKYPAQKNGLSMLSLVLASFGLAVPVTIIFMINKKRAEKQGLRVHPLDICALVLSWCFVALLLLAFGIGILGEALS